MNKDLVRQPDLADDLNDIIDRLSQGLPLTSYYRAKIDETDDEVLTKHGIKHLHLGGKDSDVLLYLVEFPGLVILLQINGHIHFRTKPKGKLLDQLFGREILKAGLAAAAAGVVAAVIGKGKKD